MIDVCLIAFRFLHYCAVTTLAGAAFFPLYAYAGSEPPALLRQRGRILFGSALLAVISGLGWFVFSVANMSSGLADVFDTEVLGAVLSDTGFGVVWMVRMILAGAVVAVTLANARARALRGSEGLILLIAAGLLASLAGVGHTQIEEGWKGVLHVAADAAHLLAAGAWLGGLVPLGFVLSAQAGSSTGGGDPDTDGVLMRFSGMGYAAVATLIGTGLINSWLLIGSVSSLVQSTYGQLLMAKLAFFAGMLALAATNRFWLTPALMAAQPSGSRKFEVWRSRLRNHVFAEQGLGLLVLLIVSILGTIRPAIGQ